MRVRWIGVVFVLAAACSSSRETEHVGESAEALAFSAIKPLTTVYVANAGALDVETQYLPQVVCC